MNLNRAIVIATSNAGKRRELQALLPRSTQVLTLNELGIESPPETGRSFLDNAAIKAEHACRRAGLPAIADDSGLEVAALGGAPGIRSARFAGPEATDEDNNLKLLSELEKHPNGPKTARFVCAVALCTPTGFIITAQNQIEGTIVTAARGSGGFGYDPHFLIRDSGAALQNGRTMAELADDEKNAISHRRRAFNTLLTRAKEQRKAHKALELLFEDS